MFHPSVKLGLKNRVLGGVSKWEKVDSVDVERWKKVDTARKRGKYPYGVEGINDKQGNEREALSSQTTQTSGL